METCKSRFRSTEVLDKYQNMLFLKQMGLIFNSGFINVM